MNSVHMYVRKQVKTLFILDSIFIQSRAKGLITKEHIVMHMHLYFVFKQGFSILHICNKTF